MMQQFLTFSLHHWELWLAFFVLLVLLILLELRNKFSGLQSVSPREATFLINREDAVVVDLRDNNAFATGHILDAINIPAPELPNKLPQLENQKAKPLILVGSNGPALNKLGTLLLSNGFKVNHLNGGIAAWQSAGLPLVK